MFEKKIMHLLQDIELKTIYTLQYFIPANIMTLIEIPLHFSLTQMLNAQNYNFNRTLLYVSSWFMFTQFSDLNFV
jgi:hypothetical protein